MLRDIEIAQAAKLKPIKEIAASVGLTEDDLDYYGKYKAKVHLDVLERLQDRPDGKYIDVTAITPTPLGEGKTVTTIGASQGLGYIGRSVMTCIRQPSMGPTFGIKGGAAGGGYAQVVPMEDFNLHLTGDIHAVSAAHNLLAAAIDSRIMHEGEASDEEFEKRAGSKKLNIDPYSIMWNRVVDISDAALRSIVLGLGTKNDGRPRQGGYDISVASEVMAILALCSDLKDIRARLGRIIFGFDKSGRPLTAEQLGVAGAMAVLMREAIMPNLMQTLEGTPAFVHAGPFANIAQGNNSIIADRIALKLVDYVVTESGFGADCGMEKFMDIKCRISGLKPNCVVIVASIRALKMHGGGPKVVAGKPLDQAYRQEDLGLLAKGLPNLIQHIENARLFGVPVVVAINKFPTDTPDEIEMVRRAADEAGAEGAFLSDVHAKGGPGGAELAEAIVAACEKKSDFQFLYPDEWPIKKKIETIATKIYRADGVDYEPEAERKIKMFTEMGLAGLPICMAKTHLSFTHDPAIKGAPRGWRMPIRDIRASAGAGFLYPLCGAMRTMPGLPTRPAFVDVDIDLETGKILGLF
ncbi:MAG TPA: formate--tetrahydrofolate ligase [Anaerolineae bacterium]|nr:formate--tetrahydrofolate ligase [Anaerolineae bacterium]HOR00320.1 formate--tetrahydrofolate ligase [Anaerolineae bacterium]HPL30008.1 formate--tetrahydrofolate ligase [Anaerolineae bacterium]